MEDDGPGFADDIEESQEPLKPEYSTKEDGEGYGLFVVKEIAEAHGWSIQVTGGPAGGARLEFHEVDRA